MRADTVLIDAVRHGRLADVGRLLATGADVNEPKRDGSGATPLQIASQNGHAPMVAALVEAGTAVNQPRNDGVAPLFMASQNGHAPGVAALI